MTSSKLSNQKGSRRDKAIIAAVEKHKVLTTEQIECLLFSDIAYGKRMAQRRMKRLTEAKRIRRTRVEFDQPYHYFLEKPGQIEHTVWVNWAYIWIRKNLKKWEELQSFQTEADFGVLRADAVAGVKNTVTGELKIYFVEVDLGHNAFDKVKKYNRLYEEDRYLTAWWVPLVNRFPAILVFTTRQGAVGEEIGKQITDLEFRVYSLDSVRKECLARDR